MNFPLLEPQDGQLFNTNGAVLLLLAAYAAHHTEIESLINKFNRIPHLPCQLRLSNSGRLQQIQIGFQDI